MGGAEDVPATGAQAQAHLRERLGAGQPTLVRVDYGVDPGLAYDHPQGRLPGLRPYSSLASLSCGTNP